MTLFDRLRRALAIPAQGRVAGLARQGDGARAERARSVAVERVELELSGAQWCERFPGDRTTAGLVMPWRRNVQAFIGALEDAGIGVRISATLRPAERAWCMRYSWDIFHHLITPELVPVKEGIPIRWEHPTPGASWAAAREMVRTYGLVARPSLNSRHIPKSPETLARAIDMTLTGWEDKRVVGGHGGEMLLSSAEDLYQLGASYEAYKLRSDKPHWSTDGR